ncbi:MAG: molybdopterin molybdotransferase MoeA [Solirubrobacteraceae bacterium]|nr:molybdopterin molybdotransferase MoeA [Solirubrobacteraceae bacterium]
MSGTSQQAQAGLPPTVPPKPGAIAPAEAWARIAAIARPLPAERVPVSRAAGRWVAEDLHARLSLPHDTNSAMDGFAVRADDVPATAAPIAGESRAGAPFTGDAPAGAVIRIATGGALPSTFDAIVPIELAEVDEAAQTVALPAARLGAHVRHAGEDVREGDLLVAAGTRLAANHLVALAAAGIAEVPCARRPVVSIVVTGDEVVPPGTTPSTGQVIDVHGTALPALIEASGGVVGEVRHAADGRSELGGVLDALAPADVVIITGGLSVGRHDWTRPALADRGAELLVERLLMRPGQPTAVAVSAEAGGVSRLWFGLPGNPVSAYVVATLLLTPTLRALAGDPAAAIVPRRARLRQAAQPDARRWLALRAELELGEDGEEVVVLDGQASHMMGDLARADGLALLEPGDAPLDAGAEVPVVLLPGLER